MTTTDTFELLFPGGRQLRQRDLDSMDRETLLAVRDAALDQFTEDMDGPHAEYLEMLAGAADEAFLRKEGF